ncbi:hypothetical protein SSP35_24_00460 [Streptomyces sp. NBRC 110611]|uniref:hypothetical protein n=1 Tax=Streptomyces sp. NBRC 110611 TaxID=1621259 RepID=UPI00082EFA2D|nr:hypothetical protein [Streptomyces sp. NBRC 110611]GAU70941.1 hypothetical protein SSP35_24_00460 [Streptomyces sp. NBRC 110611]
MPNGAISVSPEELRAAAGAADAISQDLQEAIATARRDIEAAGTAMKSWLIGPDMERVANDWGTALDELSKQIGGADPESAASRLRRTADGHEYNEDLTAQSFRVR